MLSAGDIWSRTASGLTRRDLLKVGALGTFGVTLADVNSLGAVSGGRERSIILLLLVGGPSQLETWDPKPDAPADIRGPFASIATAVPGVRISEHMPRLAGRMDRMTLIRSLHHDAAPIHETGYQLLQTGRLSREGQEAPHFGSVVARRRGSQGGLPPFVVLPYPLGNTGVSVPHGQSAGLLGPALEPFQVASNPVTKDYDAGGLFERAQRFVDGESQLSGRSQISPAFNILMSARNAFDVDAERETVRDAYGRNTFGQSCLLARRLVESGVRVVTVNMFETVFNQVTWDCHGSRPFSTLDDYAKILLPTLDRALSALLDDLDRRGLLETTLVVATGEFGRTPRINPHGGRDHWPGVWSALLAGGGIQGGCVIGSSDAHGAYPADRPVTPSELVSSIYHSLKIDTSLSTASDDGIPVIASEPHRPIAEAFA